MRRRRPISERLAFHGFDPRVPSMLRVGGGSGGGGGGGGGDGPSPSVSFLIYVMKGGNDSTGDGTDEQPYLTLGRAMQVAKSFNLVTNGNFCVILVGPGYYNEDVALIPYVWLQGLGADPASNAFNNLTLDASWTTINAGTLIAGVNQFTLTGNSTVDFTGVLGTTDSVSFNRAYISGNLVYTGDPTNGGSGGLEASEVQGTITMTGVTVESHLFAYNSDVSVVSTAAQAAVWSSYQDASITGSPSITIDAHLGTSATVGAVGSTFLGPLILNGSTAVFRGSNIPAQITRLNGAPAPALYPHASSQVPARSFLIYVNQGGDDTIGNGTEGAPYLTIGKAMTAAAALAPTLDQNALVVVGPGFYTENVVLPPYVFLTSLDAGEQSTNINGTLTLSAGWAATSGISVGGAAGLVVVDDITLDLTGTADGNLYFTNVYMAGNVTFTGDPTNGGFCAIRLSEVAGNIGVTAMDLESHEMTFDGNVNITSTAAQSASWTSIQDGSFFNGVVVTGDSTAGNSVTFLMTGTQYPFGTLVLNGAGTAYRSSIGTPASYTLLGGAAAPVTEPTGYVPTVPGNWSPAPPTSIQGALDQLAASGGGQPLSMLYVAPGGSDVTGNGSFARPYQTIAEAITVATPLATVNTPYVILIAEGTYAEAPVLPAFVSLQGLSPATPKITGAITTHAVFANGGKTSISNVNANGGVTAAFGASVAPVLTIQNSTVNGLTTSGTGSYTLTHQGATFIGTVSLTDPTLVISSSNVYQGALSVSATNQAVAFKSYQDAALGAVSMTGVANPLAATMSGTIVKGGTLSLDGAMVTYTATSGAIPATVTLAGGATSPGSATFGTVVQTGTVTLTNGVSPVTPAPAVKTGLGASKFSFTLDLINTSTALGVPRVSALVAGTSFQVTSYQSATPGSVETNDQSTYSYVITNPSAP